MTELQITKNLRETIAASDVGNPDEKARSASAFEGLEIMIESMLMGAPQIASMVGGIVSNDPRLANDTLAMAVGCLAQAEQQLRKSAAAVADMDPELRERLTATVEAQIKAEANPS